MSTVTVAKKDFKAARRSKMLWGAAIALGMIAAFVGYVAGGAEATDVRRVQSLFRTLAMFLGVLLPIVALVASYLAIAGEREGGGSSSCSRCRIRAAVSSPGRCSAGTASWPAASGSCTSR
ncbi:ABC transporter permease [Halosimplex aquaticum]